MVNDFRLRELARKAGIATRWLGNDGIHREPDVDTLRAILKALGLPCTSSADIEQANAQLEKRAGSGQLPDLITAWSGEPVALPPLPGDPTRFHIEYESGVRQDGELLSSRDGRLYIPALHIAGYHRIELQEQSAMLAIAPRRCWTFADVANGAKMWGPAAQTNGLFNIRDRREALIDFGLGTFGDAGMLAREAAKRGGDAIMISPAHALFHSDPNHFSPYSPSSRFHYTSVCPYSS